MAHFVFSKIYLRRYIFCQYRAFIVFYESSENQFGWPKKIRLFVWKNFENPPHLPRENPKSAPDCKKKKLDRMNFSIKTKNWLYFF